MHVSSTARRYGRALARVAIAHRIEKTVGTELEGLWQFFRDNPRIRLVLESPASTKEQHERLLGAIAQALPQLTAYTRNTMAALSENRRFELFREVVEAYRREVDRFHGVVEVEVVSAAPLDDAQRESLRGTLQRSIAAGKDVRLDLKVDPTLLAGLVARLGSAVYDGSLVHQLEQMKQQLVNE
jgi:F-type H+-transporting ATPase subunit delta